MKKILAVVGARPQFIKHFALEIAAKDNIELKTLHTGQHYDSEMSDIFFKELNMKPPDYLLNIGSGSHGLQTGKMMIEIEKVMMDEKPDGLIVYGDTNSTLAAALVAAKNDIKIYHIEAGIRSYNKNMPEEINRVLTDHISQSLFVPSQEAIKNLNKEGLNTNIYDVGDIMKDLVLRSIELNWLPKISNDIPFIYVTLHRPYNTDNKSRLLYILESLNKLPFKVIFSIHPRTENLMNSYKLSKQDYKNVQFIKPQGYFNNLAFLNGSMALITDSGGMQKEAYWLKKKCITIRKETEWIETLEFGWNILLFDNLDNIEKLLQELPENYVTLYGEGKAADKIIQIIK